MLQSSEKTDYMRDFKRRLRRIMKALALRGGTNEEYDGDDEDNDDDNDDDDDGDGVLPEDERGFAPDYEKGAKARPNVALISRSVDLVAQEYIVRTFLYELFFFLGVHHFYRWTPVRLLTMTRKYLSRRATFMSSQPRYLRTRRELT